MAGTLTVQNIQGPTSGANANKIIVPAGQILDVSGGTLVPSAGAVVQTGYIRSTSVFSTTSTSFTGSGLSVTLTPKFDVSRFFCSFSARINNGYGSFIDYYCSIFVNGSGGGGPTSEHRIDTGSGSDHLTTTAVYDTTGITPKTFEVYMAQINGTHTGFAVGSVLYVQEIKR